MHLDDIRIIVKMSSGKYPCYYLNSDTSMSNSILHAT